MIKKLFVFLGWLAGLVILAFACWVLGLYLGWPVWRSLLLLVAVLVAGWLLAWLHRRWLAWRLRRKLARPVSNTTNVNDPQRLDKDWKAGLRALKQSRLSRLGSPLYVLPWLIALGRDDDSKEDLLRRSSSSAPVHAESDSAPALRWWLLHNCVVLDPADSTGDENAQPGAQYRGRLLYWMMRTRRREPLNGVITTFDLQWLTQGNDAELAETGRRLRLRLDELTRIYDVRVPVYIVLTGAETFPGFRAWAASLDPDMRTQPMGYLNARSSDSASQFISTAFESITSRLLDLRILQGLRGQPQNDAFGLPERISGLAARLDKVLHSAFQATPYAEAPLLQGLFLTAKPASADTSEPDWFAADLFGQLLPRQRHAWRPIERWLHWRRFLRHAAVIVWLVACVAAAALMIHGKRIAQYQLQAIATPVSTNSFGDLSTDLATLQRTSNLILALQSRQGWGTRWLPFQHEVRNVEETLRATYVNNFRRRIIDQRMDPLLNTGLPLISREHNDLLLAASAQTLVRRINLINAALHGEDLSKLPAPGTGLEQIYQSTGATAPSTIDLLLMDNLYRQYLEWQTDTLALTEKRNTLRQTLEGLQLPSRPIQWLYSWVRLQGYLSPIRMTDYWDIPAAKDLAEIPAALTLEGEQAVTAFLASIGNASGNTAVWQQQHATFQQHFLQDGLKHWHDFAISFPHAADLLPDEAARRAVLSALTDRSGPYGRLMHDLAVMGDQLPEGDRPLWVQQAIHLDSLLTLAKKPKGDGLSGVLDSASMTNRMGEDVLRRLPRAGSLHRSLDYLREDQQALADLNTYHKGIRESIASMLQGRGAAVQVASQIWAFGHDPHVKAVPLIESRAALTRMRRALGHNTDPGADIVWKLMQGPFDFTLDYASRSAACGLQDEWESSVVNAVQGVTDQGLAIQLLYGDRGQVKAFLDGPVKNFIDRGPLRYTPREAQGRKIALNGQFFGFANHTQLQQVTLMADQRDTESSQAKVAALQQQNATLQQQISKLEATVASVTLRTAPAQVNRGARVLPESVVLTVQCATQTLTLENLNFPNSATFPWSLANCGDTTLTIKAGDLSLNRHWGGARGFIAFLREFQNGQHTYTPRDFPSSAQAMGADDIRSIALTYRQQGQGPLLAAFAQADKLSAQVQENQRRIAQLNPLLDPDGAPPPEPRAAAIPTRIISLCMGPLERTNIVAAIAESAPAKLPAQKTTARTATAPKALPKRPAAQESKATAHLTTVRGPKAAEHRPSGAAHPKAAIRKVAAHPKPEPFIIQVGVFEKAGAVVKKLEAKGYTVTGTPTRLNDKVYTRIRIHGYPDRQSADKAAQKIGNLLGLEPLVMANPQP
jgi:type VI secretion system protein ImpL